eukprot:CAMPEP_0204593658 /NCGR_PEP_ID=MMETSP0661-20131031/51632_1 /ASSEMBLY_ACC=CAM_ASM_000606 /TAXON_ID=109239 /ORGANISM="Alexandrium margalefi, Strain AMGDE01CS-322" /LENGTH=215 /DNA_ID=CAMNT_0051603983 /DNA_START=299 /DNA_END=944 /DNA_ORIENTATION=-
MYMHSVLGYSSASPGATSPGWARWRRGRSLRGALEEVAPQALDRQLVQDVERHLTVLQDSPEEQAVGHEGHAVDHAERPRHVLQMAADLALRLLRRPLALHLLSPRAAGATAAVKEAFLGRCWADDPTLGGDGLEPPSFGGITKAGMGLKADPRRHFSRPTAAARRTKRRMALAAAARSDPPRRRRGMLSNDDLNEGKPPSLGGGDRPRATGRVL